MDGQTTITPKMQLHARVFRAHAKPADMSEAEYALLIARQSEQVGHWEDMGVIAHSENGTLKPLPGAVPR